MADRNNLIETNDPKAKQASTVFKLGDWVSKSATAGQVKPALPAEGIIGLCLDKVQATDPNYASNQLIPIDGVSEDVDRFLMDVTGTATAAMINSLFDVDPTDASKLDVTAYSTITYGKVNATAFVVGDTVTGGTSTATGIITGVSATRMVVKTVTGTFQGDEVITGTAGGTGRVLTYVTGGSQFEVTQFITASKVEVKVKLVG